MFLFYVGYVVRASEHFKGWNSGLELGLGPVFGPVFRYVLRTPFVGRRLRVSNFFFGRYRFRHIVIFFVDYSHQFHPEIKFPGLCAWWLAAFPIHQEKSYESPTQSRI